jgi:hypothetical protein
LQINLPWLPRVSPLYRYTYPCGLRLPKTCNFSEFLRLDISSSPIHLNIYVVWWRFWTMEIRLPATVSQLTESELLYDWRFTTKYFVLAPSILRITSWNCLQLKPGCPNLTSSLTRGWICLLWIGFAFFKCMYRTYSMLLKILHCALHASPLSIQALQSRICLSCLCYNGSLVTWTVVCFPAAMFKPLVFSMSDFALSYVENMFILMILYDFCLLPAKFSYIIVHIRKVERRI